MSFVRVRNWGLTEDCAKSLLAELPRIVSEALDIPEVADAQLSARDIEVDYEVGREFDKRDFTDATISIEAMWFVEREERLNTAADRIREEVLKFLPGYTISIWVALPVAAYREIGNWEKPT